MRFEITIRHHSRFSGILARFASLEDAVQDCMDWANSKAYPWEDGWECQVWDADEERGRFRADSTGAWAYL